MMNRGNDLLPLLVKDKPCSVLFGSAEVVKTNQTVAERKAHVSASRSTVLKTGLLLYFSISCFNPFQNSEQQHHTDLDCRV